MIQFILNQDLFLLLPIEFANLLQGLVFPYPVKHSYPVYDNKFLAWPRLIGLKVGIRSDYCVQVYSELILYGPKTFVLLPYLIINHQQFVGKQVCLYHIGIRFDFFCVTPGERGLFKSFHGNRIIHRPAVLDFRSALRVQYQHYSEDGEHENNRKSYAVKDQRFVYIFKLFFNVIFHLWIRPTTFRWAVL